MKCNKLPKRISIQTSVSRRSDTHECYASGRGKMQHANRQQEVQQHRHWLQNNISRGRRGKSVPWLFRGIGYSIQGAGKYGLYEYFKQ